MESDQEDAVGEVTSGMAVESESDGNRGASGRGWGGAALRTGGNQERGEARVWSGKAGGSTDSQAEERKLQLGL